MGHHLPGHDHGVTVLVKNIPCARAAAAENDSDDASEESGLLGHGRLFLGKLVLP